MCLAIYKPKGLVVPRDALANGFNSNPHGAGFSYVANGRIVTVKGLFTFDAFWLAFKPHKKKQAIIHFRWATSGLRDEGNCHPFVVRSDTAVIHNGVIDIPCDVDRERSDTWHFCHHVLRPMAVRDSGFFMRPDVIRLGEAAVGSDKLCFLRADGEWAIWNEREGIWDEDVWYSNDTYLYSSRWSSMGCDHSAIERQSAALREDMRTPTRDDWPTFDDSDEPAPDGSLYFNFLDGQHKRAYEDLRQDGYSIADLDYIIEREGEEALLEYATYFRGTDA